MGRHSKSTAYGHGGKQIAPGHYRIWWTVDRYYDGSRYRHPVTYTRVTDESGAIRFAFRHGLSFRDMPAVPEQNANET